MKGPAHRGHQATAGTSSQGWKILKPILPPVKTSSAGTLMASPPSVASQAAIHYILVHHYLHNSPGLSHGWTLITRFPQAAHLRHCQHSSVPFLFHEWAGLKASHGCVETLHASRADCHSKGFIKKRFLEDVNPMRNREMRSDAPAL